MNFWNFTPLISDRDLNLNLLLLQEFKNLRQFEKNCLKFI